MNMKYAWEGRLIFDGAPSVAQDLHILGLPHQLLEAINESALPRYEGDASHRWKAEGPQNTRRRIIIQGDPYPRETPGALIDAASTVLDDWILYGIAGFERNVVQAKPLLPALMPLPGWTLKIEDGTVQQATDARLTTYKAISRGIAIPAPTQILNPFRECLERSIQIALAERESIRLFPQALTGELPVRPLDALKKLEVEAYRLTKGIGYVPAYSEFKLSRDYRLLRLIRMKRLGLHLRTVLIEAVNATLTWYATEPGFSQPMVLSFDEAWNEADLDEIEIRTIRGDAPLDDYFAQLTFARKRPSPGRI